MKHSARFAFALVAGTLVCACSSSGATATVSEPPRPLSAPNPAAVRLKSDVVWLADDARAGRRAGTEEARVAADWLAERLRALGLEPAGAEGDFLQPFEVPLAPRVGDTSIVRIMGDGGSRMVSEFKSVVPLFCSEGATAEGPLAFRGYGIESLDQEWNDFAEGELGGAIVVLLRGTPPDSELLPAKPAEPGGVEHAASFEAAGSIFLKVMNAKRRGAAGVILLQEAGASAALPFDPSQAARAGIPALSATRELFEALVGEERARALFAQAARRGPAAFGAPEAGLVVRMVADVRRERGGAYNVLARLPGVDPGRTVVIGAHYDHLGLGGEGSLAVDKHGEVHNGADDNASGTAVVLEMARQLREGAKPPGDVIFALWSGEELGLLGSEHWCMHPTLPLERVRANLNLDMVGRARAPGAYGEPAKLTVLGAGTARPFEAWLQEAAVPAQLQLSISRSGFGTGGSDHMSFMKRHIPVLHFFTGVHTDYHKPTDDSDKVDVDSMVRIAAIGLDLVERMQSEAMLPWNVDEPTQKGEADRKPTVSNRGFRVWFGSVPEYGFAGPGMRLSGTSAGSPAEKAGMLAGDVLLQVGDIKIDTVSDLSYALNVYKPGDVVEARFLRGGEEQRVHITLALRAAQ